MLTLVAKIQVTMTIYYQPPLTPIGSQYGTTGAGSNYGVTKSPYFSIANQFLPRNLHDVIRWARYITLHSPVTTEVIRKLSTYPITEFIVDTENKDTQALYSRVFDSFRMKTSLHDIGFDYHTLGNVFLSVYFPIQRSLVCPVCGTAHNAKHADFVKFESFSFKGKCTVCSNSVTFNRVDTKSLSIDDMNLIKWDPINISVNHNVITGEYEYYYRIPNEVKRRIQQGDRLFVDSVPWGFIEAVKTKQDFKFDKGSIYHMRNMSTGQLVDGVSIPPLISQYHLVFYTATLRKANEAIANDFMSPMRVIFPQAQTGNSDPVVAMSMRNFVANMQQNLIQHKQDQNHIAIAPVPIGYQAISGEGKTLLVSQEIAQAEESILLSMGVSRELLSGTSNWTSSTVGLRMLENTLSSYVTQVTEVVNWVISRTCRYLGADVCKVSLSPFRLSDDDNLRQILLNLVQNGGASLSTLYESMGMNYTDELRKIREDAVAQARNKIRTELEITRAEYLSGKDANRSLASDDGYKSALAQANATAEELAAADASTKRQVLAQLKLQDMSMYLMVSKLLEEINTAQRSVAQEQLAEQAATDVSGAQATTESAPNQEQGGQNPTQPAPV